jgi:hypothetical protein
MPKGERPVGNRSGRRRSKNLDEWARAYKFEQFVGVFPGSDLHDAGDKSG